MSYRIRFPNNLIQQQLRILIKPKIARVQLAHLNWKTLKNFFKLKEVRNDLCRYFCLDKKINISLGHYLSILSDLPTEIARYISG